MSKTLTQIFGKDGADLAKRVGALAKKAQSNGWAITQEAMAAPFNSERQINLTDQAETLYRAPLCEIAQGYLINSPPEPLLKELKLQVISVNINVFDLYRRVKRLEEARELGEKTLDDAIGSGNLELILRAGNFLFLVESAEGYELIEKQGYGKALSKFRIIEHALIGIPLEYAKGKNAVMLYTNHAANYLNIVHASRKLGKPVEELYGELDSARDLAIKGRKLLNDVKNPKDKAIWRANIYSVLGNVSKYRGDYYTAVKHFRTALKSSLSGSDYALQVAVLQTSLAHALVTQPKPDAKEARKYFSQVEHFLTEHSFGVDSYHYLPLVREIRACLRDKC